MPPTPAHPLKPPKPLPERSHAPPPLPIPSGPPTPGIMPPSPLPIKQRHVEAQSPPPHPTHPPSTHRRTGSQGPPVMKGVVSLEPSLTAPEPAEPTLQAPAIAEEGILGLPHYVGGIQDVSQVRCSYQISGPY